MSWQRNVHENGQLYVIRHCPHCGVVGDQGAVVHASDCVIGLSFTPDTLTDPPTSHRHRGPCAVCHAYWTYLAAIQDSVGELEYDTKSRAASFAPWVDEPHAFLEDAVWDARGIHDRCVCGREILDPLHSGLGVGAAAFYANPLAARCPRCGHLVIEHDQTCCGHGREISKECGCGLTRRALTS